MNKETTIVIGAGDAGALAHLQTLMKMHNAIVEVITTDEAVERDLQVVREKTFDYPAPPLLTYDYFTPPPTRAERRKQAREANKR